MDIDGGSYMELPSNGDTGEFNTTPSGMFLFDSLLKFNHCI